MKYEVTIAKNDDDSVELKFEQNIFNSIVLTDTSTKDLEKFFNEIFDHIINEKEIFEFELKDDGNDLFSEVAEDIISQLNSEIKHTENDFNEIFQLLDKTDYEL